MKLSVIMPVYNTKAEYLTVAIESVLAQSFSDFELLIVDDGSDDICMKCLKKYDDQRIRIIRNEKNRGVSIASNLALEAATGEYIVRMDSDDLAYPERFRIQTEYMDAHPEVAVCGTACKKMGTDRVYPFLRNDIPREVLQVRLLLGNISLANPTVIIRRSILADHDIKYDENIRYSLDYGLWVDCIRFGEIKVIPKILLEYREHEGQVSSAHKREQKECRDYIRSKQLEELSAGLSTDEWTEFLKLPEFRSMIDLDLLDSLIKKIEISNRKNRIFDEAVLHFECMRWWGTAIRKQKRFIRKPFNILINPRTWEMISPRALSYVFRYRRISRDNACS